MDGAAGNQSWRPHVPRCSWLRLPSASPRDGACLAAAHFPAQLPTTPEDLEQRIFDEDRGQNMSCD